MTKRKAKVIDAPAAEAEENAGQGQHEGTEPAAPVVAGVRVKARGPHEHDGRRFAPGETFVVDPELASLLEKRGDVDILELIEVQQ